MSTFHRGFDIMNHFANQWRRIKRTIMHMSANNKPRLLEQAKEKKHDILIMFEHFINHSIALRYTGDEWIEYVPNYKLIAVLDELQGHETINDVLKQFEFSTREQGEDTYVEIKVKEKAKEE